MGASTHDMPPGNSGALALLFFLRMRSALRRMRRSVGTRKGKVFAFFGVLLLIVWLGPLLAQGFVREPGDPAELRGLVPYALSFFLLMSLLTAVGERAIYFSPAEVHLLFSAPFSRRQLVLYKIATIAMGILLTSLFFGLFLYPQVGSFFAAYLGAFASFLMVQLVSMFLVMLGERLGQQFTLRLRWGIGIGLVLLIGSAAFTALSAMDAGSPRAIFEAARAGTGARLLEGIFAPFAWTLTAPNAGVLLLAFGAAMAVNGAIIAAILALDANYLETAAGVSERIYSNMKRAQRTGVAVANPKRAQHRVPRLPHLGGVGTVAWRQMTTARRSSMNTVVLILVMVIGVSLATNFGTGPSQIWAVSGMMVFWLTLILTGVLRFDFRGDLDVLETLKAMPMRPYAISTGQIAVPTAVLTVVQTAALAVPLALQGYAAYIPLVALFAIPVNGVLYTIENTMFLLYPVRLQGQNTGDISFLGRQVLIFFVKFIVVTGCVTVAAVTGALTAWLTGTVAAGLAAAWLVLVAELLVLIPYLSWAFQQFDPSQGLPD